jgi:hypothetical protein
LLWRDIEPFKSAPPYHLEGSGGRAAARDYTNGTVHRDPDAVKP